MLSLENSEALKMREVFTMSSEAIGFSKNVVPRMLRLKFATEIGMIKCEMMIKEETAYKNDIDEG